MGYRVLKIGLPKLRLSRKLLIITLGITVLLGGTGVTALYFSGKDLLLKGGESAVGGECTDVQTMVVKTPSNHLWLRKFIRMENASGTDRVRTALRIAGLLAKKNAVDLIHVSVLDAHGPTTRSQMRARSIGAEVLIALKPDNLPEMKTPAMASYYEGPASEQGRYYGDKVVIDIDEIGAMMTAMRTVEEKPDCVSPEPATDAEAKPNEHGKKDKKEGHGSKEATKPADHGAKPEEPEGDKAAEEPAKDGADRAADAERPAKEQSFLDSMLGMVGLGGGDEKPAEDHTPAVDNSHAVAEEPADAAAESHGDETATEPAARDKAAAEGHEPAAKPDDHDKAETKSHEPAADAENHDAAEKPADAASETHDDKAGAHDAAAPVKEESAAPAKAEDHAKPKKAEADEHAEMDMPTGD